MATIFRDYKAGEVVFRQGDPGNCAYIIESGRVQISIMKNDEEFPLAVLGEGEIFGEMAIIDRLPRSASATVLEASRLCVISQDSLVERIQGADPVVRLLMLMFIRRTRDMNQTLGGIETSILGARAPLNMSQIGQDALDQVRFEAEIKQAFTQGEFRMNYQPIVELKNAALVGYEALIRWHSPSLGIVRPDQFMAVIEESAIMIPVGRWIIEQAMNDLGLLQKANHQNLFISINISPRQFLDPDFIKHLEATRSHLRFKARQVKLEITEQVLIRSAAALGVIERCRDLGYQISLDDFGTGYSSISYLREMNLDVLKIDQSFVRAIKADTRAKRITQATISLAQTLGLKCVAEGIESQDIADELIQMGCSFGQGFHFGKPLALDYYLKSRTAA